MTPTVPPTPVILGLPHIPRTTVLDMIEHLRDYCGGDPGSEMDRVAKRAIMAALRQLCNEHNWHYFYEWGRLQTHGMFTDGTIQFQVSSGTYPLQLTLATTDEGVWPSWAPLGYVRMGTGNPSDLSNDTVIYQVDQLISDTVLTLKPGFAPEYDLPAGTGYTLYQDTYDLPTDFVSMDQGFADVSWGGMEFVHPTKWLQVNRYYQSYSNTPRFWTIMGSPFTPGRMCMRIFPYPDIDRTIDFVYKRRSRPVSNWDYETGTVSLDVNTAPQTIAGSGTVWSASLLGSVIRLSGDGNDVPTGLAGSNPYLDEFNIDNVSGGNTITTDVGGLNNYTNAPYVISDPVDIEDGAMLEAFFRCAEMHLAIYRKMKTTNDAVMLYKDALEAAKDADSRNTSARVAGVGGPYRQRLANMPRGPDIS